MYGQEWGINLYHRISDVTDEVSHKPMSLNRVQLYISNKTGVILTKELTNKQSNSFNTGHGPEPIPSTLHTSEPNSLGPIFR